MKLVVFDFDHTLITVNSSFRYYFFLREKKIFSYMSIFKVMPYYLRYHFLKLSPEILHRMIFENFLMGMNFSEVTQYVNEFWDKYFNYYCYAPAIKRLKEAQNNNDHVVLLSNSPDFLIAPIAKRLNVDEYKATVYGVDENDKFTDICKMVTGNFKKEYVLNIAKNLNIKEIAAYSDSIWDLPLLKCASEAIVVNPDISLTKIYKLNKWKKI